MIKNYDLYVHWTKDRCELITVSPVLRQAALNHMKDSDCFDLYQNANLDTTDDMQCFGTRSVQVYLKRVSRERQHSLLRTPFFQEYITDLYKI